MPITIKVQINPANTEHCNAPGESYGHGGCDYLSKKGYCRLFRDSVGDKRELDWKICNPREDGYDPVFIRCKACLEAEAAAEQEANKGVQG